MRNCRAPFFSSSITLSNIILNHMVKRVKVLYVSSSLCSEKLTAKLLESKLGFPNLAAQKFHRLFAQGMALNPELFNLEVIGVPEVHNSISHKIIYNFESETEKGVSYSYIMIVLIPVIRYLVIAFYLLSKIMKWGLLNFRKEKIIIFDILNTNVSIFTIIASRFFKVKLITIVTDLPEMIHIHKVRIGFTDKVITKLRNYLMGMVDGYVVLTKAMNEKVNKKNRPFMVMEGLADIGMTKTNEVNHADSKNKIILYSGGLFEKDGIKTLIEAFIGLTGGDYRLQIYGNGELADVIKEYAAKDPRISFFGYVDNSIIVDAQLKATVLVNPRFSHEEYTKYSFPSKNMEYMASGIPLLTTKLPGMPEEYYNYVYLFKEETVEGYRRAMQSILNKHGEELLDFGARAKDYVMTRKNNKLQAGRFYSCFVSN